MPATSFFPPRCDPDCVPAQRGLKRLRAVAGGKERGNAAFAAGRYEEAHQQYSAALAADPELRTQFMAQVACNRAAAAAKLGRHEDSLADAELAIELDAAYAKAYVRRAQVRRGRLPAWSACAARTACAASRCVPCWPAGRDVALGSQSTGMLAAARRNPCSRVSCALPSLVLARPPRSRARRACCSPSLTPLPPRAGAPGAEEL
jgi:tetratricopeptide (TPR) repeat protein